MQCRIADIVFALVLIAFHQDEIIIQLYKQLVIGCLKECSIQIIYGKVSVFTVYHII